MSCDARPFATYAGERAAIAEEAERVREVAAFIGPDNAARISRCAASE